MFLGRVVGDGEPMWLDDDQSKALAFEAEISKVCVLCGTRREEWDPEDGGDEFAYVAKAERCPGCETLADARENVPEDADTKGVHWRLVPFDPDDGEVDEDAD